MTGGNINMLERGHDEDKINTIDSSDLVRRSWFLGAFFLLAALSIVQVTMSGVLLNDFGNCDETAPTSECTATSEEFAYVAANQEWASGPRGERPPGFEGKSWRDVLSMARGTTVTWAADLRYMGGYNDNTHSYVPFLSKMLKEKYEITLNFVNLPAQKAVERASSDGDIDFIWLNKGNFFLMRDHQDRRGNADPLTWGPYAYLLPNAEFFDFQDPVITTDFGEPTNGEEMPLHIANFVMVYDKDNIPETTTQFPPLNIGDLLQQVNDGEISFHPTTPASFLGTPFMEQVFYHFAGPVESRKYREEFDEEFWNEQKAKVFPELKKFHEKLYVVTDNSSGEEVQSKYSPPPVVRKLFKEGEVHLSSEYAPGAVYNNIRDGSYPENSVAFTFNEKMVSNTNFLTIAKNGPNKAGAMVAINLASSMEHQYKRFIPNTGSWNGLQAFSPFKTVVQAAGWNTVFDEIETFENAPSYEELAENRIGEFNRAYLERMVKDFNEEIGTGVNVK